MVLLDGENRVRWTTDTAPSSDPFPPFAADVPRGAVLRRGQNLRHQVLVSEDGSSALMDTGTGVMVHRDGQGFVWRELTDEEPSLALDPDGILRLRAGEQIVTELAGPGEQLVVVRGRAELRDASGAVTWSTGPAPPASTDVPGPSQADLQVGFDSLSPRGAYTAVVVRDLAPGEALRRWGLVEPVEGTWQDLQSTSAGDTITVAAVPLGPHTLLMAGAAWVQGGDELSAGTLAVRHSYDPGCGWSSEWSMHRDGETISHLRDEPPKRRTGAALPEIVAAVQQMNEDNSWSAPEWFATQQSLELMCRVGVWPTAADLRGVLLGGALPAAVAQPPVAVRPARPDRPPLVVEDDLVVVRTDFSDDATWAAILDEVRRGGFGEEPVAPTDDPGWAGAGFEEVLAALPDDVNADVVYLVDAAAMSREDHAVLAANTEIPAASADYEPEEGVTRTMRIEPDYVTTMHANLSIANLSWEEYCEQLDDPENDVLGA